MAAIFGVIRRVVVRPKLESPPLSKRQERRSFTLAGGGTSDEKTQGLGCWEMCPALGRLQRGQNAAACHKGFAVCAAFPWHFCIGLAGLVDRRLNPTRFLCHGYFPHVCLLARWMKSSGARGHEFGYFGRFEINLQKFIETLWRDRWGARQCRYTH